MAEPHRNAVISGAPIILRAVFTDDAGRLIDLDSLPVIYIYDSTVTESVFMEEVEAESYDSALAGPLTATRLSTGYYTYTYTVPTGAETGTWRDLWVGAINSVDDYAYFTFVVTEGFNADEQQLGKNTLVVIKLDETISNADGSEFLQPTTLSYATKYDPLFASPDLIRLEMGKWIDYIPDSTLALMSHISSKEALAIQGVPNYGWGNLNFARTKFVVFDAVWRCLNIPGQGQEAGASSGKKKQLGDLSITDGTIDVEVPEEIYEYVRKQRDEWWRVVNAGGNIVPGQGLAPTLAIKGLNDPDRRLTGRLWEDPEEFAYPAPSSNRKGVRNGRRRGRFGFYETRPRRNLPLHWKND